MSKTFLKFQMYNLLAASIFSLLSASCAAQMPQTDKPHHTEDGYRNPNLSERRGFLDFLKWRWGRLWKEIPGPEDYDFPLANNDLAFLRGNRQDITATWIGHATLLLQLKGKNILTDPQFSQRASPVSWAGPKRVVQPGLALEDLPPIDMVLISHNHYDSLDKQTLLKLRNREGGEETTFFVPLGLKGWFGDLGISRVFEMDWWDQRQEENLKVIAVPTQHWSSRSFFSRNKTLWAGWVVSAANFRFFFVGDSGYAPLFKEIGRKLGPFDLAAIPIGAYEPRWFMKRYHMNPEEAVQVHVDVGARRSVAIHWGTFMLTDEPLDEPPKRLGKAREEKGLTREEFFVLKHGETIILKKGAKP